MGSLFKEQCTPLPKLHQDTWPGPIPHATSVLLCNGFQRAPPHGTLVEASVGLAQHPLPSPLGPSQGPPSFSGLTAV